MRRLIATTAMILGLSGLPLAAMSQSGLVDPSADAADGLHDTPQSPDDARKEALAILAKARNVGQNRPVTLRRVVSRRHGGPTW